MNNRYIGFRLCLILLFLLPTSAGAESMAFDQSKWETGDMNEQYPSDSSGSIGNSHLDHFYYYERIPMCMPALADSLAEGSASRTYDSAVLLLIVAADGLSGADSMRIFGKRITHRWSENGVSWNHYWASSDSLWNNAGGDTDNQPCLDTTIIDTAVSGYDTLRFLLDTGFVRRMIEYDNFGWLMMAENIVDRAIFQVYTEDDPVEEHRPELTVYYHDGGSPPSSISHRRRLSLLSEEVNR